MKAHVAAAKDGVGGHAAGQLPPRGSASVFKTRLNSGRPVGRAGAVDLSPSPSLRTAVAHGPHRICKGRYEQVLDTSVGCTWGHLDALYDRLGQRLAGVFGEVKVDLHPVLPEEEHLHVAIMNCPRTRWP